MYESTEERRDLAYSLRHSDYPQELIADEREAMMEIVNIRRKHSLKPRHVFVFALYLLVISWATSQRPRASEQLAGAICLCIVLMGSGCTSEPRTKSRACWSGCLIMKSQLL